MDTSERNRINFTVRTHDGRFEASARAEWRELDAVYRVLIVELLCGLQALENMAQVIAWLSDVQREFDDANEAGETG